MTHDEILDVLQTIKIVDTFSMDSETTPSPGLRKVMTDQRVLIASNINYSSYEMEVRRRLISEGQDPDGFVVGPLPWGERIGNSPLLSIGENLYLQVVVVSDGKVRAFIAGQEIDPSTMPDSFLRDKDRWNAAYQQGLPVKSSVLVRAYNINNIKALRPVA